MIQIKLFGKINQVGDGRYVGAKNSILVRNGSDFTSAQLIVREAH